MTSIEPPNYTQIPNALIALIPDMRESELKVTLIIARQTLGWQKQRDIISLSKLIELTGLSRQSVLDGIALGMQRGTIDRRRAHYKGQSTYDYGLSITSEVVSSVDHLPAQGSLLSRPQVVSSVDHPVSVEVVSSVDTQKKELKKLEKERALDADASAHPTDSLPTKRAPKTPDPNSKHPAVLVYKEIMHLTPPRAATELIAQKNPDLDGWRKAITKWAAASYNPKNVPKILDYYSEHFAPHAATTLPPRTDDVQYVPGKEIAALYRQRQHQNWQTVPPQAVA